MYPANNNNEFMQQKPITDGNVVHVFSYNTTVYKSWQSKSLSNPDTVTYSGITQQDENILTPKIQPDPKFESGKLFIGGTKTIQLQYYINFLYVCEQVNRITWGVSIKPMYQYFLKAKFIFT